MAIHIARRVRPLLLTATALAGAAALVVPTVDAALAAPAGHRATHRVHAGVKPQSIDSVQKQLNRLSVRNSQIVENFDQAQVAVQRDRAAARRANADAQRAADQYTAAHDEFARLIQTQYETGSVSSAASALFSSDSGNNYLDRLDTMNMISTHDAEVVADVQRLQRASALDSQTAASALVAAKRQQAAVAAQRAAVRTQLAHYRLLLGQLTAAQQARYAEMNATGGSKQPVTVDTQALPRATSKGAARAVAFALAQVHKPYVWGSAGPSSYDCSGLTMASWRAGGVSLPHSAAEQYNFGHHVSVSDLQPGDLLFYYQPIGHVTIYIGNGLMVSAPTEGEDVMVVPVASFSSDFTGATRLT